jgi:hypothetical protein
MLNIEQGILNVEVRTGSTSEWHPPKAETKEIKLTKNK